MLRLLLISFSLFALVPTSKDAEILKCLMALSQHEGRPFPMPMGHVGANYEISGTVIREVTPNQRIEVWSIENGLKDASDTRTKENIDQVVGVAVRLLFEYVYKAVRNDERKVMESAEVFRACSSVKMIYRPEGKPIGKIIENLKSKYPNAFLSLPEKAAEKATGTAPD